MTWETERYELSEGPAYLFELDRRDFLRTVGGGLLVLCLVPQMDLGQESGGGRRRGGFGGQGPAELGAWLHIGEDRRITVYTGKVEIGQNIRTSLAQAVAEELHVSPASVHMVMADTALTPFDMGTFGSSTTPSMASRLHRAGAAAREVLLEMAAAVWHVDPTSLRAKDGSILDADGKRSLGFGELTKGKKLMKTIGADVKPTSPAEWRIAGQSTAKAEARSIVTGKHKYASDMAVPGMLYGKVLRPAGFGATLVSADLDRAQKLPGVTVVRDGNFVGVAAPNEWLAEQALAAIQAEWKVPAQISSNELYEHLKKPAPPGPARQGRGGFGRGAQSQGSVKDALASAHHKLAADYTIAYIAHAPLEPRAALAQWQDGKLTVWTGTQRPFGVRGELTDAFGLPADKVHVMVPDMGSGYGGKHTGEAALEAARLARAAGKPVKVVWTREEEFTWGYLRPAGVIEIRSGASQDGKLLAWEHVNYNSGGSALRTLYDVPNHNHVFRAAQSPLRQGSYRGLAATANHFAREVHMDELAHAVGLEPLEFRLKNLKDQRLRDVLAAAADKFGWGKTKPVSGHGHGIAGGFEKNSYVATCAEVEVDQKTGKLRVLRAVTAFDCGSVVNPDHLKNQIEGAVVMGLGGALFEGIQFENGKILNPRFSQYRVPRFSDAPALETVLIDRKDVPSAGAGETPIVGIAPAISNAVFAACGIRLRSMPMAPNGIKA
jgi:isoquinoline 1-oxidoreductase